MSPSRSGHRRIQALADALVPADWAGDFNQAWMDLGSAVCTPRTPDCAACPLASWCVAKRAGQAEALPIRSAKAAVTEQHLVVGVLVTRGQVAVERLPDQGIWGGLWVFPQEPVSSARSRTAGLRALLDRGRVVPKDRPRCMTTLTHRLTHRLLHLHVYALAVRRKPGGARTWHWMAGDQLAALGLPTAHRRIQEAVRARVLRWGLQL
jgi:A/G-specific adenine glycosylase